MDYLKLLYTLEKVKVACPDKYGHYHSSDSGEEYDLLCQLENDGLIRRYFEEERSYSMVFKVIKDYNFIILPFTEERCQWT